MLVRSYSRHSLAMLWEETTGIPWPKPSDALLRRALVRRVGVGMQEADRHRLNTFVPEVIQDAGKSGDRSSARISSPR